jgi:hypothetical protein
MMPTPPAKPHWTPHAGPQCFALSVRGVFELLFGGSRGGGKTDTGMAWLLRPPHFGNPLYRALVVRRNYQDLTDWMDRAARMYQPVGATVTKDRIDFPNGARFRLGHLKDRDAYTKFQGHEYQRMLIEEAQQIQDELRYQQLIGSCRSTVPGLMTEVFLTANPGGIGHRWLKERFGTGKAGRAPNVAWKGKDGRLLMYIPATVENNPSLMKNDPSYIAWLDALPEPLRSAWRYGDWDIYSGQAFEWTSANIVEPCPVPAGARIIQTFDWGFGHPFSVGWWWVLPDDVLCRVGEWYGCEPGRPNSGLRLADHEIASGILKREGDMGLIGPIVRLADPTIFNRRPDSHGGGLGESTATIFQRCGVTMLPGEPARTQKFRQFAARVKSRTLLVFRTCRDFVRTVPELPLDEDTFDDVDTDAEDHVYDEACHACMHVPLPDDALRGVSLDGRAAVKRALESVVSSHAVSRSVVRSGSLASVLSGD